MKKEYRSYILMNPITYFETLHEFKQMAREVCGTGKAVTIYPNGKIDFHDEKLRKHFEEKSAKTESGLLGLNGAHYVDLTKI